MAILSVASTLFLLPGGVVPAQARDAAPVGDHEDLFDDPSFDEDVSQPATAGQDEEDAARVGPNVRERFAAPVRVSSATTDWCATASDLTPNFGDYIGSASVENRVLSTWADGRNGVPDTFYTTGLASPKSEPPRAESRLVDGVQPPVLPARFDTLSQLDNTRCLGVGRRGAAIGLRAGELGHAIAQSHGRGGFAVADAGCHADAPERSHPRAVRDLRHL